MVLILAAISGPAFAAGSFLTQPPVIASRSGSQPVGTGSHEVAGDPDVDAYGNEVNSAVAEYSLDDAGELYELHSPQTELPRLGSPKS
jgi:hypothetical protein